MRSGVALAFLLVSTLAFSMNQESNFFPPLPKEECAIAAEEFTDIYLEKDSNICVLIFTNFDRSEAVVNITKYESATIFLETKQRNPKKGILERYTFKTNDKKSSVTLDIKSITKCIANGKPCTATHQGTITLSSGAKSATYRIAYFHESQG